MEREDVRDTILDAMFISLEAQLRALKRLRGTSEEEEPLDMGMSQVDMVYNILKRAGQPLHISQIIEDVEKIHKVRKSGGKIKSAFWQRDPLSPPFHVNFLYGLRFIHASLIFPHYRDGDFSARGYPVRFVECPATKKPGKKATDEERAQYKKAVKTHNLSQQGLEMIKGLRVDLDCLGGTKRKMVVAVDGSLCNRTILSKPLDRVEVVGRCREHARG